MRICKDCKWARARLADRVMLFGGFPSWARCVHEKAWSVARRMDVNDNAALVNGKSREIQPPYCSVMRLSHEACGHDGKLFEAKSSPPRPQPAT
jgi:hypothetical protein